MPYDPKRLNKDRAPKPLKPAPRGRDWGIGPVPARDDGTCRQCGKPYRLGDSVFFDAITAVERRGADGLTERFALQFKLRRSLPTWLFRWLDGICGAAKRQETWVYWS